MSCHSQPREERGITMRKAWKQRLAILLAASMVCSIGTVTNANIRTNADNTVYKENGNQQPFEVLTSDELTKDMGAGWNLGNTMDGHTGFTPNETVWQSVKTTKKMIKSVHDLGFNTVRIPVTWGTMIDDNNNYQIDEAWISRVQDIVDYCISQDMYAIVNIHHDGAEQTGWLRIATEDQKGLEAKFKGVWNTIAERFKDYGDHLIFESMNEVKGDNMTVAEENQVIVKLNQIFLDTVRATGSNNAERWLMVPGKYNFIDSICNPVNKFSLPEDSVESRLILSVHCYTPWEFCGQTNASSERYTTYSYAKIKYNIRELKQLYETYTSQGIPVAVGEYGCVNKDNPTERAYYLEALNRLYKQYNLVGIYWDMGWFDRSQKPDYSFSIIDRKTGKPIDSEVTDALMRGYFSTSSTEDCEFLEKSPEVIPMTELTLSESSLNLQINETKEISVTFTPETSNDVVLWKTDDPTVATVAYGRIHAKGEGSTNVTVYTQNGSVSHKIPVTVTKATAFVPCSNFSVSETSYNLIEEEYAYVTPQIAPADCDETVYYRSSNEEVATISSIGKILAVGKGTATVMAYTTGGLQKEITVNVKEKDLAKEILLSINVYYNDSNNDYYSNEISEDVITVTGNGQYQLTFNCETDLSSAAKAAGVNSLSRMTAVYIKDYQVAKGINSKSPLSACNIRYDQITVDGVDLTINKSEYKSALKKSGIFDTNDPINSWDGSAVNEVGVINSAASFTNISNPKKITITFTLNQFCFEGMDPDNTDPTPRVPLTTPTTSPETTVPPTPSPGIPAPVQPTAPAVQKVSKGDTITKKKITYQVTRTSKSKKEVSISKSKNTSANITIPSSVKVKGTTYKVTGISKNAFKNDKKLTSIKIPSTVTSIGKNAFVGCKNLKKITCKAKTAPKIGSNAFKQISKKAIYTVPKRAKKSYKKKLTAKTGYKKTMKITA